MLFGMSNQDMTDIVNGGGFEGDRIARSENAGLWGKNRQMRLAQYAILVT